MDDMAAGYQTTLADINNQAGALVIALWNDLEAVHRFKLWLDDSAHNDAYLTALGMASGDITTLRNSIADLGGTSGLWAVSHGSFAPGGASNYFSNAKLLTGANWAG
jgi:hypothetical protein